MTNVLNSILANQPINKPVTQDNMPAFTFSSEGRVRPMKDKGRLLPSRVIGSPFEYAQDLKKDILSIGKAAKGQANDHELGRINDLAMKLGSLGLASYLFVKNPLKLSKTMEFVGFGTFFASMALWPKLAIQAPIKARTGVDIHQKYIDSQGRKKMVFQDPQYVLTDLYSKDDLNKMGKKLGVSEDIPDRDSFIKQRAQKTALQGNTLWMLTAGFASPLMSALACNRLEKPLNKAIEKYELVSSERAMQSGMNQSYIEKFKQFLSQKSLEKYLAKNANSELTPKVVEELTSRLGKDVNSAAMQSAIREELSAMKNRVNIDLDFVKNALSGQVDDAVFASLSEVQKTSLNKAIKDGSFEQVGKILSQTSSVPKRSQVKVSKEIATTLSKAKDALGKQTVAEATEEIKSLASRLNNFASKRSVLDRFISARVGDQSGTYIANQWGRVCDKLIKSLNLNSKELKALSNGDMAILESKLQALASNEKQYNKVVKQLMKLIGDYEQTTSADAFTSLVSTKAKAVCSSASDDFGKNGFLKIARKLSSANGKGTIENAININTAERVSGAKSSFYRLMQSLDFFKQVENGQFTEQLKKALQQNGQAADEITLQKLTEASKNLLFNATTTDYVEKLKTAGFSLSDAEYKTVMQVLFNSDADTALAKSIGKTMGADKVDDVLKGFLSYKTDFMSKVANWQNGMTTELSRRTVTGVTNGANAVERNNLAGKAFKDLVKDAAKQTYNSNKWLKIFGGAMLALTATTLVAGLAIGRKGETEKQVEEKSKVNG